MSRRQVRHVIFDPAAVKARRGELDLSQENLARAVGVTLRTVQRWEDGSNEPQSYSQLLSLARALDVEPDALHLEEVPAA